MSREGPVDTGRGARRPIRHVEYQVAGADELKRWYDYYGLTLEKADDHKEEANVSRYLRGESSAFPHVIDVRA